MCSIEHTILHILDIYITTEENICCRWFIHAYFGHMARRNKCHQIHSKSFLNTFAATLYVDEPTLRLVDSKQTADTCVQRNSALLDQNIQLHLLLPCSNSISLLTRVGLSSTDNHLWACTLSFIKNEQRGTPKFSATSDLNVWIIRNNASQVHSASSHWNNLTMKMCVPCKAKSINCAGMRNTLPGPAQWD